MTKEEKKAKERHDKELFVETKLYPLLDAINHSILYAEFVVDDGDEFVEITYSTPLSALRVNVTDCDLLELSRYVLARIGIGGKQ